MLLRHRRAPHRLRLGVLLFADAAQHEALVEPAIERFPLGPRGASRDGAVHRPEKRVVLQRFDEVVPRPRPKALDHRLRVGGSRHDDDGQLLVHLVKASAELHAIDRLHVQVREHDVGKGVRGLDERRLAARCRRDRVSLRVQQSFEHAPRILVVVDEQEVPSRRGFSVPLGSIAERCAVSIPDGGCGGHDAGPISIEAQGQGRGLQPGSASSAASGQTSRTRSVARSSPTRVTSSSMK